MQQNTFETSRVKHPEILNTHQAENIPLRRGTARRDSGRPGAGRRAGLRARLSTGRLCGTSYLGTWHRKTPAVTLQEPQLTARRDFGTARRPSPREPGSCPTPGRSAGRTIPIALIEATQFTPTYLIFGSAHSRHGNPPLQARQTRPALFSKGLQLRSPPPP